MSNSTSTAVGDGLSAGEIVAFVCMIEWAIIHVAAMFMIGIPAWSDKSPYGAYDALMGVDAYKKEYDAAIRPRLSGKILWQHAFNLGWIGLWAGVAVPLCIYHQNRMAWVMSLVPFLADVGYFVAFDLFKLGGGMAQAQTYIISVGSISWACSSFASIGKNDRRLNACLNTWQDVPEKT
jgi:hypothetical protein